MGMCNIHGWYDETVFIGCPVCNPKIMPRYMPPVPRGTVESLVPGTVDPVWQKSDYFSVLYTEIVRLNGVVEELQKQRDGFQREANHAKAVAYRIVASRLVTLVAEEGDIPDSDVREALSWEPVETAVTEEKMLDKELQVEVPPKDTKFVAVEPISQNNEKVVRNLYRITLVGLQGAIDVGHQIAYVVAEDPTKAYEYYRKFLDDKDLGYHRDRELNHIDLVAKEGKFVDSHPLLFIKKEN